MQKTQIAAWSSNCDQYFKFRLHNSCNYYNNNNSNNNNNNADDDVWKWEEEEKEKLFRTAKRKLRAVKQQWNEQ